MAEYERQDVKDRDTEQARTDHHKYSSSMSSLDKQNAEADDRAIATQTAEIMAKIKAKGTEAGDCAGCPRENVPLFLDLCGVCTYDEVWLAVSRLQTGAVLEKYRL